MHYCSGASFPNPIMTRAIQPVCSAVAADEDQITVERLNELLDSVANADNKTRPSFFRTLIDL